MLCPLHNKDSQLVGWISPTENIFDTNMVWVAFIQNGHAWAPDDSTWIGPVYKELICLDQSGKPIAWHGSIRPEGNTLFVKPTGIAARLARPVRPCTPERPVIPPWSIPPLGGWSEVSFVEWFEHRPPKIRKITDIGPTQHEDTSRGLQNEDTSKAIQNEDTNKSTK